MKKRISYPQQVVLAVVLGGLGGWIFGERARFLGELSLLLIQFLKTLAAPLIFFAIVDAFCKTQVRARSGIRLLLISGANATVAGIIALTLSRFFPSPSPAQLEDLKYHLHGTAAEASPQLGQLNLVKVLRGIIPESVVEPFTSNHILSLVLMSILVGVVIRHLKKTGKEPDAIKTLENVFSGAFQVIQGLLSIVLRGIPFAVFGIVAKLVGTGGVELFSTLGIFVVYISLGILLHSLVYYSFLLKVVGRTSPLRFFQLGGEALLTAMSTGSSLATLPVTLRTLQDKMKISHESSRLAACVGTNLNHDGILLYEAMTTLFVAQLSGITLGVQQKVVLLLTSTLAAVGIAGIPDAGLITLSLVLGAVGLPLTWVPVLMTVDWFIGRLRATSNVTSDMVVATLLDRIKSPRSK